jgi:bifunctional non-homologous end joining protein LigD
MQADLYRRRETDCKECKLCTLNRHVKPCGALPTEDLKECRWLKPLLVAQIEFREWTPDGHLRLASLSGLERTKSHGQLSENS